MKAIDLTGREFGKLKVLGRSETYVSPSGQKVAFFNCICECGNQHKVRSIHLRRGKIISCGNCDGKKHGESGTILYRVWNTMRNRTSENYKERHLYFDKGIKVCEEWTDYKVFSKWAKANGYKSGLQIDRENNSKGYSPENCRWVDVKTNANNRDVTFQVNYKGVVFAFTSLVDIKNLRSHERTIRKRIENGWTIEDAFDKPFRVGNYKRKQNDRG
ncbi:hypothetical protein CMU49_02510 [Elizabethkingia anophelis]|nr:hypothetical protein [Elizabethkingia anophelis]MDV3692383.1 hypothetical protein [Elizabethkingia anophelis]